MTNLPNTAETVPAHVSDYLPAFALGSLDPDEQQLVTAHLAQCASCRLELEDYERVVTLLPLAAAEAIPSPSLKKRLMERVAAPQSQSAPQKRFSLPNWLRELISPPVWRPLSALAILILLVANFFLWRQLNQPGIPGTEIILTPTDSTSATTKK